MDEIWNNSVQENQKGFRKRVFTATVIAFFLLSFSFTFIGSTLLSYATDRKSQAETSENPLKEEMRVLDKVFREVVSAVAVGDGDRVHRALEAMHGTMEKTHEGVHSGKVTIPKNADKTEEFIRMDKAFHEDLESLAHAAHEYDQGKMLSITVILLDSCVNCHKSFWK